MGLKEEITKVFDRHDAALADARAKLIVTEALVEELKEANKDLTVYNTECNTVIDELMAEVFDLKETIRDLELQIKNLTPVIDDAVLPEWGAPVFREEFDGDLSKWNVRNNFTTIDTAKAMAANATVEDGNLHLKGTWLSAPQTGGPRGFFTHNTGYIDTRKIAATDKHFSQEYGRWEIRCKVPTGENTRGALAAFWLRNDDKTGEIDIMEAWGFGGVANTTYDKYIKNTAVTTFHSNTMGSGSSTNGKPYIKTFWRHFEQGIPRNTPEGFHTYAFEYMPDYIAMFVDGKQVFRVTPSTPDPQAPSRTLAWLWDADFFGGPKHMRINLHVGPSEKYWGLPDPNKRELTQNPLDYEIEYVRVYKK